MCWDHKKFFAPFVSKLSHCSDWPCKSGAPHWITLYLLTLPSFIPSFLHLTHVSNHYWENSARPEKKNCHKTKSNEVIDKTSGGPHAMTCSCNLALIRYFCSLLGGPGGNWSKQICLQIICLISDEHYRNTQAGDHSDHTDPASQPAS